MIDQLAFVRTPDPSRFVEEYENLKAAAKEDGHGVQGVPTFLVQKGADVVGYFAVQPSVLLWLHSRKLMGRESFYLINTVENIIRQGAATVVVPCPKASPLYGYMKALGFESLGEYELFTKKLI